MAKAKLPTLREYGIIYGCSHEQIRKLKGEGIDLADSKAVVARLCKNPDYACPEKFAQFIPSPANSTEGTAGLRAAIDRLRLSELVAHNNYQDALANNPPTAGVALKNWTAILEQLRKVEEANPDIEQANSNSISKEELAETLGALFKDLRQDLDALPNKIATLGQQTNKTELKAIVQKETGRIIDSLCAWKGASE